MRADRRIFAPSLFERLNVVIEDQSGDVTSEADAKRGVPKPGGEQQGDDDEHGEKPSRQGGRWQSGVESVVQKK